MRRLAFLLLTAMLLTMGTGISAAWAGTLDFSVLPTTGHLPGAPGSTIGWGYSLTNESSTDWLVTTALNTGPFLHAVPTLVFDFPVLNPGASVTVPFDFSVSTGLFELTWDSSAPIGFSNSGNFVLSAEWWTGDPFLDGLFITTAPDTMQPYSATVVVAPEPQPWMLLASGIISIVLFRLWPRVRAKRQAYVLQSDSSLS